MKYARRGEDQLVQTEEAPAMTPNMCQLAHHSLLQPKQTLSSVQTTKVEKSLAEQTNGMCKLT
jgi:hypothetical protein